MSTLAIILGIYIIGFFLSLLFLSKFGEQIGWGGYNPPHDTWYDDYDSNASAFVSFSLLWPLFYLLNVIRWFYLKTVEFSQFLININKK